MAAVPEDESDFEDIQPTIADGLGKITNLLWEARKVKLHHDAAVIAWALSVDKQVREDVNNRMTGKYHDAIERVLTIFFVELDTDIPQKIEKRKTGLYFNPARWLTPEAVHGKSHLWREKFSLPYTEVLGVMGCRYTSKQTGIGPCESVWGDVKKAKSGKRTHLSGDAVEKQAVLYTTARISEARIK
ncbi:hypothetical protein ACHAWF_016726 [Thalassiosira exigua]